MYTIDNNEEGQHFRVDYNNVLYFWDEARDLIKKLDRKNISEHLENLWFYIWNSDGEFSEKNWNKVVDEVLQYIEEYEWEYNEKDIIKEYVQKHYPYHT